MTPKKRKALAPVTNPPPAGLGPKTRTVTITFDCILGELIRDLRKTHALNQITLAQKAGIHQSILSRIEMGGGTRLCNLRAIAAAFGTTLSILIAEAERRWEKL